MALSSGLLTLHKTLVNNRFGVLKTSKADILSLFTLMKAFEKFTLPNHIILCRVTRKIVATIGTFLKIILECIINYFALFSLEAYMQYSFMS
jgi:hypothetical protein